jgi:hypothetical protein
MSRLDHGQGGQGSRIVLTESVEQRRGGKSFGLVVGHQAEGRACPHQAERRTDVQLFGLGDPLGADGPVGQMVSQREPGRTTHDLGDIMPKNHIVHRCVVILGAEERSAI